MAVIYNNKHEKHLLDVNQHDSRNITIALKTQIGSMALTGTPAPHGGTKDETNKPKQTEEKIKL